MFLQKQRNMYVYLQHTIDLAFHMVVYSAVLHISFPKLEKYNIDLFANILNENHMHFESFHFLKWSINVL